METFYSFPLPALLWVLLSLAALVQSEMFTSTRQLVQLAAAEGRLLDAVENYIEQERKRIQRLTEITTYIRKTGRHNVLSGKSTKSTLTDPEFEASTLAFAGHPINAYHLLRDWSQVQADLESTRTQYHEELQNEIDKYVPALPTKVDLQGAAEAIVRLQTTYALSTNETANGVIRDKKASQSLSPEDCYGIGMVAVANEEFGYGAQWLERAIGRNETLGIWVIDAMFWLGESYKRMGNLDKAVETLRLAHERDPTNRVLLSKYRQAEQYASIIKHSGGGQPSHDSTALYRKKRVDWHTAYEKLCRGDPVPRDPEVMKRLVCVYKKGILPYINYKEEIFNFSPRLSIFYDVISDSNIQMLKEKALDELVRSEIGDPGKPIESGNRVSKTAWLWDFEPEIERLSARVADITGLHTAFRDELSYAEPFQVLNYGMGGQYESHFDTYDHERQLEKLEDYIYGTGDRIVTFMFYLSSVEAGGSTVFPDIQARVPAVKGAAAFWYNFKKSGERDMDTKHAGCPVLLGEKWVANKWIHQYGQEYKRPCGLREDDEDPF